MGYVVIESGVVTNVIEWDGNTETWSPPQGATVLANTWGAGIGWTYDGKECVAPTTS